MFGPGDRSADIWKSRNPCGEFWLQRIRGTPSRSVPAHGRTTSPCCVEGERRRARGQHGLRARLALQLRDEVLVPARRQVGVRVDQQVVLLAAIQLLHLGARPAVAAALPVRKPDDAKPGIVEVGVQTLAVLRLPADAEAQPFGVVRTLEGAADREGEERVPVGGDRDEDLVSRLVPAGRTRNVELLDVQWACSGDRRMQRHVFGEAAPCRCRELRVVEPLEGGSAARIELSRPAVHDRLGRVESTGRPWGWAAS